MLRIWRLSGQQLTASADECANTTELKKHLCKQYGLPALLQHLLILLHAGNHLGDGGKLEASMELQAVLSNSGLSERDNRLAEKKLTCLSQRSLGLMLLV